MIMIFIDMNMNMIMIILMIINIIMIMILEVVTFAIYAYFSLSLVAEQVLRFSIIFYFSITSQLYLLHHTNHANQIKLTILICLHLKMSLLKQQHNHDSI